MQWFQTTSFDPFQLMEKNRTVSGFLLSTLTTHPDTTHAMKELVRLYNEGVVKPRVDSVFSFEEVEPEDVVGEMTSIFIN